MSAPVCQAPDCSREMVDRRPDARFCSDACRAAAWKANVGYGRGARKPSRTRANGPRRAPSRRLAWGRAVEAVAPHVGGQDRAEQILAAALPGATT